MTLEELNKEYYRWSTAEVKLKFRTPGSHKALLYGLLYIFPFILLLAFVSLFVDSIILRGIAVIVFGLTTGMLLSELVFLKKKNKESKRIEGLKKDFNENLRVYINNKYSLNFGEYQLEQSLKNGAYVERDGKVIKAKVIRWIHDDWVVVQEGSEMVIRQYTGGNERTVRA